ncbi:glutathione S-transferase C-terminal domain-containing protein homolog [Teleopsis dalmanni]|uniref:glutathione S-transferase C-terminal domain-containing protein homolog n=1 Tax=Teleopsis dalmanni TaxID=139649 RepID=UPI000D329F8B|nr:glutathione S-transferase C-terminal domain-containing protein homolog [Teleopsis dalmanni]
MDTLFLEIEISTKDEETEIYTTTSSFVALFVHKFLDSPENIQIKFVCTKLDNSGGKIKLRSDKLHVQLTDEDIICKEAALTRAIQDLRLPVYAKDGNTFISGMCAVCREIVARQSSTEKMYLLGFKQSCLLAPAEASIWTRFCELDMPSALNDLLYKYQNGQIIDEIPTALVRFERHMNEPVRMHNIYKVAREKAKQEPEIINGCKVMVDCSIPKEKLAIEHRFAEGIAFTIADLVLYPCIMLIFDSCPGIGQFFPLVKTWIEETEMEKNCLSKLSQIFLFQTMHVVNFVENMKIPDCDETSLYKKDPKRYKPRNRIFTLQSEVSAIIARLEVLDINFNSDNDITYEHNQIDWDAIEPNHEKGSALPQNRLVRKRQQLENIANAVISLAKSGDRIVDFCSGTGHLGILLALQLPECTIILIENKAISLERAKKRANELKLKNMRFYQCNIDYFEGNFDLGTSLHACGTATDIVIQQCLRSRAKFVCCPCCYGALQPMPHIKYPLSQRFRDVIDDYSYLYIAHTADQSHELGRTNCKPEITRQGQHCMDIIDTDRKLQAEEIGYRVVLTRLKPEQCTPKNHLLVGHLP